MTEIVGPDGRPTGSGSCDFQLEISLNGPINQEAAMQAQARRVLAAFVADSCGWYLPVTWWFESRPLTVNAAGLAVVAVRLRIVGQDAGRYFGQAAAEAGITRRSSNAS